MKGFKIYPTHKNKRFYIYNRTTDEYLYSTGEARLWNYDEREKKIVYYNSNKEAQDQLTEYEENNRPFFSIKDFIV